MEPILSGRAPGFWRHNRSDDVDRLYLAGAGTHPGTGLPGVISSVRDFDGGPPPLQCNRQLSGVLPASREPRTMGPVINHIDGSSPWRGGPRGRRGVAARSGSH